MYFMTIARWYATGRSWAIDVGIERVLAPHRHLVLQRRVVLR